MPNWACSELTITGEEHAIQVFLDRAAGTGRDGDRSRIDFRQHAPIPDSAEHIPPDGSGDISEAACRAAWGTKWNVTGHDIHIEDGSAPGSAVITLITANAGPSGWLAAVAAQHPDLDFEMFWGEPNNRSGGHHRYQQGKHVIDFEASFEEVQEYMQTHDRIYLVVNEEDLCGECGALLDDGEGWDGLCGSCADAACNNADSSLTD